MHKCICRFIAPTVPSSSHVGVIVGCSMLGLGLFTLLFGGVELTALICLMGGLILFASLNSKDSFQLNIASEGPNDTADNRHYTDVWLWCEDTKLHIKFSSIWRHDDGLGKGERVEEYVYDIRNIDVFSVDRMEYPFIIDIGGECECSVTFKAEKLYKHNITNLHTKYTSRLDLFKEEREIRTEVLEFLMSVVGHEPIQEKLVYAGDVNKCPYMLNVSA